MAFERCEGRLVSGAVSRPAACPLGLADRASRPAFPGRGWCGHGDPAPVPQRALLRAVVARCGGGGRTSAGEGALRRCEGRLGSGALTPPAARPQGRLPESATHVLWAQLFGRGCATRLWGGRPGLGACRVCGACRSVFVCWWVRGGAVCAVVPWCVVLPPSVRRPGAPLSCTTSWCCARRGLWLCPLPRALPLFGCWLSFFFLLRCGVLYPFLYTPFVCPPPWRAFFPASLVSLCVIRYFSLPASSFSGSFSSSPS